jgi:hypothetical protein
MDDFKKKNIFYPRWGKRDKNEIQKNKFLLAVTKPYAVCFYPNTIL